MDTSKITERVAESISKVAIAGIRVDFSLDKVKIDEGTGFNGVLLTIKVKMGERGVGKVTAERSLTALANQIDHRGLADTGWSVSEIRIVRYAHDDEDVTVWIGEIAIDNDIKSPQEITRKVRKTIESFQL